MVVKIKYGLDVKNAEKEYIDKIIQKNCKLDNKN
jgi:hypothetical protein